MSVSTTTYKNFVGGKLVESRLRRDDGGAEPRDRRDDRRGAARERRGRRARGRRGAAGGADVGRAAAEGADGAPAQAGRRDRRERRRADEAGVPERRQADVDRGGRDAVLRRQPALLRRRGADARGEGRRRVRGGVHVHHPPRAARHRRRDHAVELPADDGGLEARAGARGRQRPDPEAGRADAADDAPLRRAGAGGPAAGCAQRDHRRRRPGRRRARAPPRHRASSRSRATSRPARRSRGTPPTRSSACTSSSAGRRRWSCSTTPIRPRSPRR